MNKKTEENKIFPISNGMRQSHLLSKTRKDAPKDEISKNSRLLIRAGFVNKEIAGVYSYLPLGLRVLNKVNNIIRDEMNKAGGQELFLTALQDRKVWEATDRWSDMNVDNWFKTKLKNGTELGLGFTHEESLTELMKNHIRSYKDLPVYPYQIQTKFRNEARAKSGIMRCREFLMKDLYSFSKNQKEHEIFYNKMRQAYTNVFEKVGLGDITYFTFASGGSFSKYSHEFQTITDAGEDMIYCCEKCMVAVNKEVLSEQSVCPECKNKNLIEKKSSEVGNIFTLGTRFSEPLGLVYLDENGEKQTVFMGSYGIGPGRIVGTVVEALADDKGLIWPASITPFSIHLIEISSENDKVRKTAESLYDKLAENGIEVLYDDRDARAGEKFNDSDLIGIPLRIVVSEKGIEKDEFEIKERKSGKIEIIKEKDIISVILAKVACPARGIQKN
jgi:prolyl-tRNA synthetase